MADEVVPPATNSEALVRELQLAGALVRVAPIPGAGHFWSVDPVDEGFGAYAGPKVLRFLEGAL